MYNRRNLEKFKSTLHLLEIWGTETVLRTPKKVNADEKKHVSWFAVHLGQTETGPTTTVTLFLPLEAV